MKRLASLLLVVMLSTSCSDFLSPTPQSTITVGNFYKSQDQINQAVSGVYSGMASWPTNIFLYSSEFRSKNYIAQSHNAQRDWWDIATFTVKPEDQILSDTWRNLYAMINRANVVLQSIDNVPFTNPALETQYRAETRFLRAFAYFQLVRLWGRVPLVTKTISPSEATQIKQSEPAEIYNFVATEMSAVKDSLPASYTGSDIGRLTKYAAEGLLARVYLTMAGYPLNQTANYAKAAPLLQDVIAHEGSGYSLAPDYRAQFSYKNDNKYHLFEIQFISGGVGAGSEFPEQVAPPDIAANIIPFRAQISASELGLPQDLLTAYEPGDKRFLGTIDTSWVNSAVPPGRGNTPWISKFVDPNLTLTSRTDWPENFPVLRYADVLLMDAEVRAALTGGPDATGVAEINRVRAAAGLKPIAPTSKADFDAALRHERRIEFVGEGRTWFDMVRWGIAVQTMNDFFTATSQNLHIDQNMLLFPIPLSEINIFPGLYQQNPGY